MTAVLSFIASRKTAVVLLIAAVISSLVTAEIGLGGNYPVIVIVGLLSISLTVCLQQNFKRWLRRNRGLLLFHIGLVGTSIMALVSGLTHYHAYFELSENQSISNEFTPVIAGPLYRDKLGDFELTLLESDVSFQGEEGLGLESDKQIMEVSRDGARPEQEELVHNQPLLNGHYRFYLALSYGYSVVFRYIGADGSERPGVVKLPPYPDSREAQISEFVVPGVKDPLAISLDSNQLPYDPENRWTLDVPDNPVVSVSHSRDGQRVRSTLSPGTTLDVAGGTLEFTQMRKWHGFLVDYDPTRSYLLIFVLLAMLGITWHYIQVTRGRKG